MERFSHHGRHRLALAYANTYHVGETMEDVQGFLDLAGEAWAILPEEAAKTGVIGKAGSDAADALEAAARGEPVNALLHRFAPRIHPEVYRRLEGDLRWHFMRQA